MNNCNGYVPYVTGFVSGLSRNFCPRNLHPLR